MGIKGLIPIVDPALEERHIAEFRGQVAAVDVSGWLYRAYEWNYIRYVSDQVAIIRGFKVTPVLVFDGETPGAKEEVVKHRASNRDTYSRKARKYEEDGDLAKANKYARRAARRSPEQHGNLKEWCRDKGVAYVQAPYEADAQITFLVQSGQANFAITEDSDFLAFGCQQVLFKYSNGFGYWYDHAKFPDCLGSPYDLECFRATCILLGSDYWMGGLKGFGPVRGKALYQNLGGEFEFDKMISFIDLDIDDDFEDKFYRAVNTFLYQLIWNSDASEVLPLTPYPEGKSSIDYPYAGLQAQATGFTWNPPVGEASSQLDDDTDDVQYKCNVCERTFTTPTDLRKHMQVDHPLDCETCGRTFHYRRYLESHQRTHHQKHDCSFCNEQFTGQFKLNRHLEAQHSAERPFACKICSKNFKRESALSAHMNSHTVSTSFACDFCDEIFKNKKSLDDHVAVHLVDSHYLCGFCEESFKTEFELTIHVRDHFEEDCVACEICGLRCKGQDALDEHLLDHPTTEPLESEDESEDEPRPFPCKLCSKSFVLKRSYYSHLQVHRDRAVECDICGKVLNCQNSLDKHIKRHDPDRPFKCTQCSSSFYTNEELKKHMQSHSSQRNFVCKICGDGFKRQNHLDYHLTSHSAEKKFECSKCDKKFKLRANLNAHMKTHDPENDFTCHQCNKPYATAANLKRHTLNFHTAHALFVCDTCNKNFASFDTLRTHKKCHEKVRAFKCAVCGHGCFSRGDLNKHMVAHQTERPFACELCPGKTYKTQFLLNRHMNTVHATERKFKCTQCDKSYTSKYSLDIHLKSHSTDRAYICKYCNESFKYQQNLGCHLKNCPKKE